MGGDLEPDRRDEVADVRGLGEPAADERRRPGLARQVNPAVAEVPQLVAQATREVGVVGQDLVEAVPVGGRLLGSRAGVDTGRARRGRRPCPATTR